MLHRTTIAARTKVFLNPVHATCTLKNDHQDNVKRSQQFKIKRLTHTLSIKRTLNQRFSRLFHFFKMNNHDREEKTLLDVRKSVRRIETRQQHCFEVECWERKMARNQSIDRQMLIRWIAATIVSMEKIDDENDSLSNLSWLKLSNASTTENRQWSRSNIDFILSFSVVR